MRFVSYGIQLYNFFLSNKKKFLYIPLGLYWALIFILTSIPGEIMPKIFGFSDKIKHFGAYLVLSILLGFTLYLQNRFTNISKKWIVFTLLITSIYGLFDEVHQIYIPGRYFDWWDFFADVVGSVVGIVLVKIIISEKPINQSELEQS